MLFSPLTVDRSPCNYRMFNTLRGAAGKQAYPVIDLLQEVIDRGVIYENANGRYMVVQNRMSVEYVKN